MPPIIPTSAEVRLDPARYNKMHDTFMATFDCAKVPEDDRLAGTYGMDEKERPIADKPKPYRGFVNLPDLNFEKGRALFYKGHDRGVNQEEDAANVRLVSDTFVESLFEDYREAHEERLHSIGHTVRGMFVLKYTEKELDRLQRSPELFASPEAKASFQARLVAQFRDQQQQFQQAAENNRALDEQDKREREALNPTYKPNMPDWSQFLSNGAPGVPALPHGPPRPGLINEQVLPPAAYAIVQNWEDEYRRLREFYGLEETFPDRGRIPNTTETRNFYLNPNPFRNHDQQRISSWNDSSPPLTLPQVNRVVAQAFGSEGQMRANNYQMFEGVHVRDYADDYEDDGEDDDEEVEEEGDYLDDFGEFDESMDE